MKKIFSQWFSHTKAAIVGCADILAIGLIAVQINLVWQLVSGFPENIYSFAAKVAQTEIEIIIAFALIGAAVLALAVRSFRDEVRKLKESEQAKRE